MNMRSPPPEPKPLPKAHSIPIVYSTEWTRSQARKEILEAKDSLGDRAQRERDEIMSVALAQPHRRGDPSRKAGSPLWAFCEARWPNDNKFRHKMYVAGCTYEQIVRDSLIAFGLPYLGQVAGPGSGCGLTEEEIAAERDRAKMKRNDADGVLISIDLKAKNVAENVCYWQREPGPYDEDRLANGLYRLADWLGLIEHGINAGRGG